MSDFRTLFVITYPRHGQHFLMENLPPKINVLETQFRHTISTNIGSKVLKDSIILTVIRNPIDTIASKIIFSVEINESNVETENQLWIKEKIKELIPKYIKSYVDTYNELNEYENLMVIDFEGFLVNPHNEFDYIFKTLKSDHKIDSFIMPKSHKFFLATSKKNENYDYCYNEVMNNQEIARAFKSYDLLKKRLHEDIDFN